MNNVKLNMMMLDYIQQTLNIDCSQISMPLDQLILPLYKDLYELIPAKVGNQNVLFITPRNEFPDVRALGKHMDNLKTMTQCFVALFLDSITEVRRKALLQKHIPFVVENNQIYLPFIGIELQEKLKLQQEEIRQFTPATQLLFLYYFNQNKIALPAQDFVSKLNYSQMTITRALRQLKATGLFQIQKGSVKNSNILVCTIADKRELFYKIEQYLINPVKDIFYINKEELKKDNKLVAAGDTYLSFFTMISTNDINTWAYYGSPSDFKTSTKELVEVSKQAKVEQWKYAPGLAGTLSNNDPLSVYLSFNGCTDERINKEKKQLITKAIEDSNADTWS